ncbi:hypothetical protein JB92DRAFT_3272836 [Gautieria morchelliformis]|nr:hypothetical protein JB92DRAFT_3272836 [Gautieria morchelliformis]
MRWVLGHEGIEGNKRDDAEAKRAAQGHSSKEMLMPIECRGVLPNSNSADTTRRQNRQVIDRIDPSMPSNAYNKISRDLPRKQASLLIQLRTGHVGLSKHLYRIRKAESRIARSATKLRRRFIISFLGVRGIVHRGECWRRGCAEGRNLQEYCWEGRR